MAQNNARLISLSSAIDADEFDVEGILAFFKKSSCFTPNEYVETADYEIFGFEEYLETVLRPLLEFLARNEASRRSVDQKGLYYEATKVLMASSWYRTHKERFDSLFFTAELRSNPNISVAFDDLVKSKYDEKRMIIEAIYIVAVARQSNFHVPTSEEFRDRYAYLAAIVCPEEEIRLRHFIAWIEIAYIVYCYYQNQDYFLGIIPCLSEGKRGKATGSALRKRRVSYDTGGSVSLPSLARIVIIRAENPNTPSRTLCATYLKSLLRLIKGLYPADNLPKWMFRKQIKSSHQHAYSQVIRAAYCNAENLTESSAEAEHLDGSNEASARSYMKAELDVDAEELPEDAQALGSRKRPRMAANALLSSVPHHRYHPPPLAPYYDNAYAMQSMYDPYYCMRMRSYPPSLPPPPPPPSLATLPLLMPSHVHGEGSMSRPEGIHSRAYAYPYQRISPADPYAAAYTSASIDPRYIALYDPLRCPEQYGLSAESEAMESAAQADLNLAGVESARLFNSALLGRPDAGSEYQTLSEISIQDRSNHIYLRDSLQAAPLRKSRSAGQEVLAPSVPSSRKRERVKKGISLTMPPRLPNVSYNVLRSDSSGSAGGRGGRGDGVDTRSSRIGSNIGTEYDDPVQISEESSTDSNNESVLSDLSPRHLREQRAESLQSLAYTSASQTEAAVYEALHNTRPIPAGRGVRGVGDIHRSLHVGDEGTPNMESHAGNRATVGRHLAAMEALDAIRYERYNLQGSIGWGCT